MMPLEETANGDVKFDVSIERTLLLAFNISLGLVQVLGENLVEHNMRSLYY